MNADPVELAADMLRRYFEHWSTTNPAVDMEYVAEKLGESWTGSSGGGEALIQWKPEAVYVNDVKIRTADVIQRAKAPMETLGL